MISFFVKHPHAFHLIVFTQHWSQFIQSILQHSQNKKWVINIMHESQGEGFKCQSDLLKCFRINDKLFKKKIMLILKSTNKKHFRKSFYIFSQPFPETLCFHIYLKCLCFSYNVWWETTNFKPLLINKLKFYKNGSPNLEHQLLLICSHLKL